MKKLPSLKDKLESLDARLTCANCANNSLGPNGIEILCLVPLPCRVSCHPPLALALAGALRTHAIRHSHGRGEKQDYRHEIHPDVPPKVIALLPR
jgi:hypothetical protein